MLAIALAFIVATLMFAGFVVLMLHDEDMLDKQGHGHARGGNRGTRR